MIVSMHFCHPVWALSFGGLQDRAGSQNPGKSSVLGQLPLSQIIPRRERHGEAGTPRTVAGRLGIEMGLAEMALVGLARGSPTRRKDFVREVSC